MAEYAEPQFTSPYPEKGQDRKPGIVDDFHVAVSDLRGEITQLIERLDLVSRPDYAADKIPSQPEEAKSSLREAHDNLRREVRRLEDLRARLEI